jgi:hypothetical protein
MPRRLTFLFLRPLRSQQCAGRSETVTGVAVRLGRPSATVYLSFAVRPHHDALAVTQDQRPDTGGGARRWRRSYLQAL